MSYDKVAAEQAEARRQWYAALRSGEFRQGRENLCINGEHCCLGVACELFVRSRPGEARFEVPPDADEDNATHKFFVEAGKGFDPDMDELLPRAVQRWLGIQYADPVVLVGDQQERGISTLNDAGTSFAEIAELLERAYPAEEVS